MGLFSAFRPPVVGLDLGSYAVRAVALRPSRKGWSLLAAGEAPVPFGETPTQAVLAETAAGLLDSLGLQRARVAAAISGQAAIVKRLNLPMMTADELAAAIPAEAEQHIPFPLEDVQLDYEVLEGTQGRASDALDVLLVAARRDKVEDRVMAIADTGRTAVVLDVEAFALANAYEANYPDRSEALVVLVHVGQRATVVCLLENGKVAFTRDIGLGGAAYVDALTRDLGLDPVAAQRTLRQSLSDDDGSIGVIREVHHQLLLEIRKTVDFHRATASVDRIDRVVLSGGACGIEGLRGLLASDLEAEVEIVDPFRRVQRPQRGPGADVDGPAYAVAVGLALRREGER